MAKIRYGKMGNWLAPFSVFLSLLTAITAQPGFLSISCGDNTNHTAENDIIWVTDAEYINVGQIADTGDASINSSYLHSLRFFPMPLKKSCYKLPVTPDVPYHLRLWFAIGVYNGFQNWPSFQISIETLGMLHVEDITIADRVSIFLPLILVSSGRVLYVCLMRTSVRDDPFISAIELRRLQHGMYAQAKGGTMLNTFFYNVGGNSMVRSLDNNHLMGSLPNFSNLTRLERLYLHNNNLNGTVPAWLSELKNLKELNIANNSFSGVIPAQLLHNCSLKLNYSGNLYLRTEKRKCTLQSSKRGNLKVVLGTTLGGFLIIGLIVGVVYRNKFRRKEEGVVNESSRVKKERKHFLEQDSPRIEVPNPTNCRAFTLDEMTAATETFSREIGRGGFGSVFFGKLQEGKEIAVKVLSLFSHQGVDEFLNEVDLLSRINHRNLVSLLGYCNETREVMLIYEHMSKGSLRDHLYGPTVENSQLTWKTRLKITLDAAQGLEYLHLGCTPKIIHRDVKTANILLDGNFTGKVADFGLSRMTIDGQATHVTTAVKGTFGYLDPE